MEPLISVILPVYNMEQYLARCIDSILANTYTNLEILCVDDGSGDGSLSILNSYARMDSRFVVIAKENGGVSSARNAGLDHMTGEYVTFIDPDDFVHPKYFEFLLLAAQTHTNSMTVCGYRSVEEKDLPVQTTQPTFDPKKLTVVSLTQLFQNHNYRSYCWGRLIHSKLIQELRFREELPYAEDSAFIAELGERNPELTCVVLSEELYYYFQRADSLVKQAKVPSRYQVAKFFTDKALSSEDNEVVYLDQAIKFGLSTRYYAVHIHPNKKISRQTTSLLKACLPSLRQTVVYSRKWKTIFAAFILFPGLYWLYRSVTEPNMWRWEKVERKKRREEKRNSRVSH